MHHDNHRSLENRNKVLKALSASFLLNLTPDDMLAALQEERIESVTDLVARLAKAFKESTDARAPASTPLDLQSLSKPAPPETASAIVHRVPKVPFILNGTEYDPKDIRRFDGRALHFVAGSRSVARDALLVFDDRTIVTNWVQMISLTKMADFELKDASSGPSQSSGTGILVHGPEHPPNPKTPGSAPVTGVGFGGPASPPPSSVTSDALMFWYYNFQGPSLSLGPHQQIPDLGIWSRNITSLWATTSLCGYFDTVGFQAAILLVVPGNSYTDLDLFGWDDRIVSVQNFG
jgi:hypothetical protein